MIMKLNLKKYIYLLNDVTNTLLQKDRVDLQQRIIQLRRILLVVSIILGLSLVLNVYLLINYLY